MTRARDIAGGTIFTSSDNTKLDGIAAGATVYAHPTGAGNKHVPTAGATGQLLQYASAGTAAWATIETGTPAIVTPTFASPDSTYTSSGTYSKPNTVADTDLMWVFIVNGGGGGGGDPSGDFYGQGGNGGNPLLMYGPASAFDGATYVIGLGGASGSGGVRTAGGASYITLSSSNGSTRYDTAAPNANFMHYVSGGKKLVGGTTMSITHTGGVLFNLTTIHSGWVTTQSNAAVSSSGSYSNYGTIGAYTYAAQHAVFGGGGGGGQDRQTMNDSFGGAQSFLSGNGGVGSSSSNGTAGDLHGGGGGAGRPNGGVGGSGSMRVYYV